MTTHYNLEIISTSTHFKVTYRDKKFRSVTHLRGGVDDAMLKALGKIIPRLESEFISFKANFHNKVIYTKENKGINNHSEFLNEWTLFYNEFAKMPPKIDGSEINALKAIRRYLLQNHSEDEALSVWKLILEKWDTLDDFHKNKTTLKYINSQFNIIINAIKKQHESNDTEVFKSAMGSQTGQGFKFK